MRDDLVEMIAALCHDQWSGWMKYMASKGEVISTRITQTHERWTQIEIPTGLFERWKRQMDTPYEYLPENEKESDRKEANRFIELFVEIKQWEEMPDPMPDIARQRGWNPLEIGEDMVVTFDPNVYIIKRIK